MTVLTTRRAPVAGVRPDGVRPPLIGDATTTFAMAFCAVTPVKGSPLVWPVLMGLVLLEVLRNRRQLVHVWVSLPLVTYLGWMWMSLLWSVEPAKTANELFMNLNYVLLGLLVAVNRSVLDLMMLLSRAATWLLLACWAVTYAVPSFGRMSDTEYAGAMRGLFIEKNQMGYFSVIAFLTALALAIGPRRGDGALCRWGPVALALATVLGSTSKTALGVCIAGVGIGWALTRLARARRPLALPLVSYLAVAAATVVVVTQNWTAILTALGRDATLTGRTHIWQVVISVIHRRPVFGFGWKALWIDESPTTTEIWALHYGVPFYHAHNGYLDLAAQLGLVGAALAVGFLLHLLVRSARGFARTPSPVTGWPVLLLVVVLLYNATEVVAFTNTTWLVLMALSCTIRTNWKEELCTSPTQLA